MKWYLINKNFCQSICACLPLSLGSMAIGGVHEAIEWKIEDGGNGHWYGYIGQSTPNGRGLHWNDARDQAAGLGGQIASIESEEENLFIYESLASNPSLWFPHPNRQQSRGPWVGLYAESEEWYWSDGTLYSYSNWAPGEPYEGVVGYVRYYSYLGQTQPHHTWDNNEAGDSGDFAILEWSADCNGDGIVDYGQIVNGDLFDIDQNGVPDICEACVADLSGDGNLDFFDVSGFLVLFQLRDSAADFNGDNNFDFFDVSEFLMAFAAGCP